MRSKEEQEQIVKRALSESIETEFVDPTEGRIIAVEICSTVLEAHIWISFDDDFNPGDGLAIFYVHELEALKKKTAEELRAIHRHKLIWPPGTKVGQ